jgi:hypothetical protein
MNSQPRLHSTGVHWFFRLVHARTHRLTGALMGVSAWHAIAATAIADAIAHTRMRR